MIWIALAVVAVVTLVVVQKKQSNERKQLLANIRETSRQLKKRKDL